MSSSDGFAKEDSNYSDYSDNWYLDDSTPSVSEDKIILLCNTTIPTKEFHICVAPLSVIVLSLLVILVKCTRQGSKLFSILGTAELLEPSSHKELAASVFGLLFCSLCTIVLEDDPLPLINGSSHQMKEYWKILAFFYYPVIYFPLLGCAAVRHRIGYVLGAILSWLHCGVLIWQKVECPYSPKIYTYYQLLSSFPQIGCLLTLSVVYPTLLIKNLRKPVPEELPKTELQEDMNCQEYVKELFRRRKHKICPKSGILPQMSTFLLSYVYLPEKGFYLPTKLCISSFVGLIAVYQVALLLVVAAVPPLQKIQAGITEDIAFLLAGFNINLSDDRKEVVRLVQYYLWVIEVCFISALVFSCFITLSMIMKTMVQHRENLKALYRGDLLNVFHQHQKLRSSRSLLVSWMSFTSYQTAVICLALVIEQIVLFICVLFFAYLIAIPVLYGRNLILLIILSRMWPFWLLLVLVVVMQHLTAEYVFLHNSELTQSFLKRLAFYVMTYLLFIVNVLAGVVMGIWRMVISGLFNVVHLSRLDISLLNQKAQYFDPGYNCYSQYLRLEACHLHPVLRAFCFLLIHTSCRPGQSTKQLPTNMEEGIQLMKKEVQLRFTTSKQIRARWHLTYTLLRNPSLKLFRRPAFTDSISNGTGTCLSTKSCSEQCDNQL
ncbi:receptor for retinol uptake STRA6 [Protopterus annectens]|uniref:receptor for retinol uptake STRA6 n=1 Tax=Protopterus annectens TaxID=7888 RepID=UPI001CF9EE34|nr:receptor for retinol uptake STRA6 [Protopterus annectens]XP_043933694.1 receptor for retinol uptake STRA6 [Protopterus annectens]XP_043933695.1 receptor for retinol uptake STRA6 [Protopterus annectens]